MGYEPEDQRKLVYKNSTVTYYIKGNREGKTIFMLHPAFADHTIFNHQTDYFKDKYQIITLDMPGHGQNQFKGSTITINETPEIIHHILAENGIKACHLIGVSLGSLVAQSFADRYPHQAESVTIVGGYSIHKANEHILKAQRKEGLKWILYILFSMKKFRNYVTSVSCHTSQGRELFNRGIQHFTRRSFPAMSGMNALFTKKDTHVPYPLLIITGEHDIKLAQDAAVEMHALEKHSHIVHLSGAGHCANVDTPR